MKKLLLILSLLVPSLLLSACAPMVTHVVMPGVDESTSVQLVDFRPETEKENEIFSFMITSSGYGIYRKGDQTLDPPMTQLFRRLTYEKLAGGTTTTPNISIYHMVVYKNLKSELRKEVVGGSIAGPVGAAVTAGITSKNTVNISQSLVDREQFEKPDTEEYERAFYTDAENPAHASVFVIYIDAAVNGKRIFVKTMAPIRAAEGQNAYTLAVQSSIQYYLNQYAAI